MKVTSLRSSISALVPLSGTSATAASSMGAEAMSSSPDRTSVCRPSAPTPRTARPAGGATDRPEVHPAIQVAPPLAAEDHRAVRSRRRSQLDQLHRCTLAVLLGAAGRARPPWPRGAGLPRSAAKAAPEGGRGAASYA